MKTEPTSERKDFTAILLIVGAMIAAQVIAIMQII